MPMKHINATVINSRKGKFLLTLLLLVLTQSIFAQTPYIRKYRPLADSLSAEYGIPTAVILGVAIIESGSGTSRNSKLLNNHFGIIGKNDLMKTNGIRSRYKYYKDVTTGYVGFCKVQKKKKYYDKLKGNMDYKVWLDAMSKAGYSEVPEEWKQKISSAIRKYKLGGR